MKRETKLANPALEAEVKKAGDPDLARALAWSKAVNEVIGRMVLGVPPFPLVRESLARLATEADLLVVSATPNEALHREWEEHDLAKYVVAICGQEIGTKKEILTNAKKYPPGHTLMIGDAPGDYQAAQANGTLFFPDQPGGRGGQLAATCTRKASIASFPKSLPAGTNRSCSRSSTVTCPSSRHG